MRNPLYYLFFAVILFASCKDEDDSIPLGYLDDSYELAQENTDSGIWYVSQYHFKSDGTVELFYILRESQNGPDLGYSSYTKGTYMLQGQDFSVKRLESFSLDSENFPEGYTEDLEELTENELGPFAESKGTLKRINNGDKIAILFECNDVIGMLTMCIGEQVYDRVD